MLVREEEQIRHWGVRVGRTPAQGETRYQTFYRKSPYSMLWKGSEGKNVKRKSSELMNRRSIGRRSEQYPIYDCVTVDPQGLYPDCSGLLMDHDLMFRLSFGHR
jgi:hypothetical protein